MITIGLKKDSGSAQNDFSAVIVEPDYFVAQATEFDDINQVLRYTIDASYKQWNIKLGFLTESQMDYLLELKKEEAPQFIYESTTYNVRIPPGDLKPRRFGGTIRIINTVKES